MGKLWDLYEDYLGRQAFPPSQRRVAARLEMSPTAFGNWRSRLTGLPEVVNLARFAMLTHVPYERVLDAALHDAGYLPPPRVDIFWDDPRPNSGLDPVERENLIELVDELEGDQLAARDVGGPSKGQQRRADADSAGEPAIDDADDVEPR